MNLPGRLGAYARLVRLHQPVGIWLLLWPTLWALWIAGEGHPDQRVFIVFVLGTVVLRSAGCIINDYADRKIDAHVWRTKDRPLATGEVSVTEALTLFVVLMLVGLGLVLTMNRLTVMLAVIGAFITVLYPFTKRFISFPQLVLGIAFSWGVPMAFAAQLGTVPPVGWAMFAMTIAWGVIYDTEYAMADRVDDLKIGVRSVAILLGHMDRLFVGVLQVLFVAALVLIGLSVGRGAWFLFGTAVAALIFLYQQYLIRDRDSAHCFAAFRNNAFFGACVFAAILLDYHFGS
ncbi:MAG: 4-hydroxybenzoate octaprenyltransferase [Rhodospirillaceae bacterium]|nr:4-hydroxybenzoate octaprenyltransferase [Rhodospirillaceae bacterium]